MASIGTFTKHNLKAQGFGNLDDSAMSRVQWPLRFTPGVSVSLIAIGLALHSQFWLGAMALVALSGALLPKGMLIDLLYNFGARHLFHAQPLPPSPKPRQFSYALSTVFLAGSALSFHYGFPVLGLVLGGLVCIAGTVLTTTLWCLGSWYHNFLFSRKLVATAERKRVEP